MAGRTGIAIKVLGVLLWSVLAPMQLSPQQAPQIKDIRITSMTASPPVIAPDDHVPCTTVTVTLSRTEAEPAPTVAIDVGVFFYHWADPHSEYRLSIVPSEPLSMLVSGPTQDYEFDVCGKPLAPQGTAVLKAHIYSWTRGWNVQDPVERPFVVDGRTRTKGDLVPLEVRSAAAGDQ